MLLPPTLADPGDLCAGLMFSLFSFNVERLEGRVPLPGDPPLPPCLTSLRACAPKLSLLPKEGDAGVFKGGLIASSSSIIARSSSKLLRRPGDVDPVVAKLALLCLANALYGDDGPLLVLRPRAMDIPRRWFGGLGKEGVVFAVGEVEVAEVLVES